ncbi:MAG: hypothetical protein AAF914_15410 [Pseudomonadota bacterium]
MKEKYTKVATVGSAASFAAALDTVLGTGTVEWLVELCLTGPEPADMPQMPMEHGRHGLLWTIAGLGSAAIACLGTARREAANARLPWAPRQRPVLAALAFVAASSDEIGPEEIAAAYAETLDPPLTPEDATIAFHRFSALPARLRAALMAKVTQPAERRAVICAALRLARRQVRDPAAGVRALETLADELSMDGLEICAHWDAAHTPPPPSALDLARDAARAAAAEAQALAKEAAGTAQSHAQSAAEALAGRIAVALPTVPQAYPARLPMPKDAPQ